MKKLFIFGCFVILSWVLAEMAERDLMANSTARFAALSKRPVREELAKGKFLIANPQLQGTYFGETVILLTDHDISGSMGLIVNRPTSIALSALGPEFKGSNREDHLYVGGTCGQEPGISFDPNPISP